MESHDTAHGGADPEDQTSGGSGGEHGTETSEDWDKDQKFGPDVDEQDTVPDTGGEPTTKPGASEQTPGQTQQADEPEST